ncbi:NAD-dependent epimerase/dehydratase family protein [Roseomonas frigidaquae]|uniref:NAD-dependent epimerase/dehydratase family protein n=1 Tax=Falsiroseomonas frigidaquae TaxID=487318 RepID=A0ABX1EVE9_9PROT|nr:NAD-dependent epimerase/dehydratase family protein [Falsiroseomonas frigidaquae]NKE44139.1 NAD-dependent epimerase/dehydratase family protein [Falsiroseomonas frigidaquae]
MTHSRILITGGNGYVGRYLTDLLRPHGQLCIADMLRYGNWRFPPNERDRLRLEEVDIRDAPRVAALMASFRPQVVVHLAALHYIPECEADPALAVSTNVQGTLNLLLSCPEGCRFVFASSGAVYKPDDRPHHETTSELGPNDIYGFSKLHGEHYVSAIAAKRRLKAVIVRLFNVIGPGETNPHLLPELIGQLKAGRNVIELGNLSPRRDYISVRDAAAGFCAVALHDEVETGATRTVNLGTSRTYSVAEVVEKLRRISGINFEIRQAPGRVRQVDRPMLAADNRSIEELYGWRVRQSIDDTLKELWQAPDFAHGLVEKYL